MTKRPNKLVCFYAKNRLTINLVFLGMLYFAHCFWGDMMYVAFPLLLLMVLFDNNRNGLTYLFFSIPFCMINLYLSAVLFCACALVYLLKFYAVLYFKEKTKPNWVLLVLVGLLIVYCCLPPNRYNGNWGMKLGMIFGSFAIFGMVIKKPNVVRLGFNIRIFALAILVSVAFASTYYFSPYMSEAMTIAGGGGRGRFEALMTHPNVFAMVCEFVIGCIAYFIMSKRGKWFDWLLLVALTVSGFFTLSKTFMVIMIVVYLVLAIWMLKENFARTVIVGSIVITALIILGVCYPNIVMIVVNRFVGTFSECHSFADFMNMITTDRYNLWIEYATYLGQNPLVLVFGAGLGAPVLHYFSAHNFILTGVYSVGIVGMLLILAVAIAMIVEYRKNAKPLPSKWIVVPIIVMLMIGMVEDLIFYIV